MLDNAGENFLKKVFPRTPFQKLSKAELLYLFGNLKTIEHQDLKFFGTPFSKERCGLLKSFPRTPFQKLLIGERIF
jgi:hypothetical protein